MHSNKIYEKEPIDMIVNNVKKYAYTVLLTKVEYFPGALVLAESLCSLGTEADLIIMVSSNIPDSIRMILRRFYSKIIQIKRIPDINEKYNKLQALTLLEYNKVIVIDIDTIVLKYPDYLFTLDTPAVYILKDDGDNKKGDNKKGIIYSGLYVLTPNMSIYNKITDVITNKDKDKDNKEYKEYINHIFTKIVKYKTIINTEYLGIKHSADKNDLWKKAFMIQFVGDKPFLYKSKYSIEERVERGDNKLWFFYYSKIINKNFNLLKEKELDDVNSLSKYYLSELSRQIYTMTKVLQLNVNTDLDGNFTSRLNKIFKTNKIKKNFIYYHIDSFKEYNSTYAPYPQNLSSHHPQNPNNPQNPSFHHPSYIDSITTSGKYKLVMLIGSDKTKIDEEIKDVSLKIETRYDYKMKGYVIKNILVVLESELTYTERMDIINEMYKDNDKYYYVSVIVIVYNDKLQLKNTDNIKIYEDVNNKMKLSSILFNKNTFNMIKNKKLDFFKKYSNILENLKFQSLKKWIYNNYLYNELQNLLIIIDPNLLITDPNLLKTYPLICSDYEYVIIDSNNYSNDIIIKKKVDLKLFFFDIIFTKSSLYKNKCNNILNMDKNIFYTIDAINMTTKSTNVNER